MFFSVRHNVERQRGRIGLAVEQRVKRRSPTLVGGFVPRHGFARLLFCCVRANELRGAIRRMLASINTELAADRLRGMPVVLHDLVLRHCFPSFPFV